nr:peptidoglycan editing factor PgeF [Chlamydia sp. 17-3921]
MSLVLDTGPLDKFILKELEKFPIKHGIFPKQHDVHGKVFPAKNLDIVANLKAQSYCDLHQRHSTTVRQAKMTTPCQQPGDGLFTKELWLSLHIRHSDCQAAIFYDQEHHVIANVHCGWRGLIGNIYAVTAHKLRKFYNSQPSDLIVAIGPSLGPNYSTYPDYNTLFPRNFQTFMEPNGHINFRGIAYKQLRSLGIPNNNITILDTCTYTKHELFFSARYIAQHPEEFSQTHTKKQKNNTTAVMLLPRE